MKLFEKMPRNGLISVHPRHWKKPPDNIEDAIYIRNETLYWFNKKTWYHEMEKRHGVQYMFENYFFLYFIFNE